MTASLARVKYVICAVNLEALTYCMHSTSCVNSFVTQLSGGMSGPKNKWLILKLHGLARSCESAARETPIGGQSAHIRRSAVSQNVVWVGTVLRHPLDRQCLPDASDYLGRTAASHGAAIRLHAFLRRRGGCAT